MRRFINTVLSHLSPRPISKYIENIASSGALIGARKSVTCRPDEAELSLWGQWRITCKVCPDLYYKPAWHGPREHLGSPTTSSNQEKQQTPASTYTLRLAPATQSTTAPLFPPPSSSVSSLKEQYATPLCANCRCGSGQWLISSPHIVSVHHHNLIAL